MQYKKTFLIIFVILLITILGCKGNSTKSAKQVNQIPQAPYSAKSSDTGTTEIVKLCGDWPDSKIRIVSKETDFKTPYDNSQLVGVTSLNLYFYCSSDSLDTIIGFFKSNKYIEISNFKDDDPFGYEMIKNIVGSRSFKVIKKGADATRTFPPFSTFVVFEAGSRKTVIVAYH